MRRASAAVLFAVSLLGLACSSDSLNEASPLPDLDANQVIERSLAAMEDLRSYQMEFTLRPEGEPVTFLVRYQDPNSYYERLLAPTDDSGTFELILLGDKAHGRDCKEYPDDCEAWEELEERPPIPGGLGLTTFAPETLGLVALELAEAPEMLGSDEGEGQQLLHYRGSLNLSRTVFENQRRAYAGEAFSESCDGTTCRTLTVEEYYQEEYGDTDFGNVPPSSIDIWVSPQDFLLHSIVIGLPAKKARAEQPDPSDTYFQVDYSRFNEVTIEPPE